MCVFTRLFCSIHVETFSTYVLNTSSTNVLRFFGTIPDAMNNASCTRKILADNVRAMMAIRGWKQTELAKQAQVSQKAVSDALNCRKSTQLDIIAKLAQAFKLETYQLMIPNLINPEAFVPHRVS